MRLIVYRCDGCQVEGYTDPNTGGAPFGWRILDLALPASNEPPAHLCRVCFDDFTRWLEGRRPD